MLNITKEEAKTIAESLSKVTYLNEESFNDSESFRKTKNVLYAAEVLSLYMSSEEDIDTLYELVSYITAEI